MASSPVFSIAIVIIAVATLLTVAAMTKSPRSLVLVVGGAGTSCMLGAPLAAPDLIVGLLLPPLLFAAAAAVSLDLIRRTLLPGSAIGALLVALTAIAGATTVRLLAPGLSWSGAALLGIFAALADIQLATDLGLLDRTPRSANEVVMAQGLVSPAIIFSASLLVIGHVGAAPPSAGEILATLGRDVAGGCLIGVAVGILVARLLRLVRIPGVGLALTFAAPFAASMIATALAVSVILALVVAGLAISALAIDPVGDRARSPRPRVEGAAFWSATQFLLSGLQFFLAGFVVPGALAGTRNVDPGRVALLVAALLLVAGAVQLLAGLMAARVVARSGPASRRRPGVAEAISLLPNRSSLALLLVMLVPARLADGSPYLERDLIVASTIVMFVASALVNWLALPHWFTGSDAARTHAREQALAHRIVASVDTRDHSAVDRARRRLLRLRRRGIVGDAEEVAAQQRLDLFVLSDAARDDRGRSPPSTGAVPSR